MIPAPFPPKPETVEAGWELTGECRIPHDQNEMHFPIYALGADLRWYSASRPVYGTRSAHATGFVGRRWIARRVEKPEVKKAVKTILAAEKISMAEARQVALHAQEEAEKRRQDYRELTGYDNDFDDIRPTVTSYDPGSEGLDTTVTTILGPLGADALNAMNPKETDMSNDLNLRCPKCGRHPEYPKDVLRFDSRRGEIRMCCPTCKGVSWLKPLDAANDASKPSQPVAQSPDALPWRYRWPLHGPYTAWLSFWNTIWSATGRWAALGAMASGVMLWAVGPERTWRVAVALGGYVKHLIGMVC